MSRESEREEAAAPSKWGKLKESLLGRKPAAAAPVSPSLLPETAAAELTAGDRKKKGRSERRQMERTIAARLTPTEYADIAEKAARAGLTLSAYSRACLLGDPGLRAKRAPPVNRVALGGAIAALNRVGNNVNQIAHHLNAGGHSSPAQIAEAQAEISDCLKAILAALGKATDDH